MKSNRNGFLAECPDCDAALAALFEPSLDSNQENRDRLSDQHKAEIERIERRLDSRQARMEDFEASMLKSPEQLPDLSAERLELIWEVETPEAGLIKNVILFENQVIWREQAHWQDHERFALVAGILKDRYGDRLEDLVPTRQAELYLYGDSLAAVHYVDAVRRGLREAFRQAKEKGISN